MKKSTPNLFEVLGVRQNATPEEIKKAYRAKAKELRPDLGHNRKAWDEVSEAFRVLSDSNLRAKHKADLEAIAREKAEEDQRSAQFDDMFSGSFGGANVPPKQSSAPKPPPPNPPRPQQSSSGSNQPGHMASGYGVGSVPPAQSSGPFETLSDILGSLADAIVLAGIWLACCIWVFLWSLVANIWIASWAAQIFTGGAQQGFPVSLWFWLSVTFGVIGGSIMAYIVND